MRLEPAIGTQLDKPAQRRPARRYMAPKLVPWFKYDLDFCLWLQQNFDRLVEELTCKSH